MPQTRWVLDLEGNGANPNEPIEIGMVEMIDWELTGRMHAWRFKPMLPVTYHANRVHGISNKDLRNCPRFEEQADEIKAILGDHAIVGHSVSVELHMLEPRLEGWRPSCAYDTLKIAKRLLPDQRHHKLQVLCEQFDLIDQTTNLTGMKQHSGLFDAVATALLLQKLAEKFPTRIDGLLAHSDIMKSRRAAQEQRERQARNRELRNQLRSSQNDA